MRMPDRIKSRRSVRKYSDQEITNELLSEIIDLACFSSSWKNTQVVRYHVIKNLHTDENKIRQSISLPVNERATNLIARGCA